MPADVVMHLKSSMKLSKKLEEELLVEVKRAQVTFQGASHDCRVRHEGNFRECLEPAARSYGNALREFSSLILNGKLPERTKTAD